MWWMTNDRMSERYFAPSTMSGAGYRPSLHVVILAGLEEHLIVSSWARAITTTWVAPLRPWLGFEIAAVHCLGGRRRLGLWESVCGVRGPIHASAMMSGVRLRASQRGTQRLSAVETASSIVTTSSEI